VVIVLLVKQMKTDVVQYFVMANCVSSRQWSPV